MSNYQTILQNNNTAISENNTDLQSLIEQANNLPDAGDGYTTETWILTLEDGSTVTKEVYVE